MLIAAKTISAFFALIALAGGQVRGEVAPARTGTSLAVIGDSYAAGIGAGSARAFEYYTALDLGWSLDTARGYSGAGYVNATTGQTYETALTANPIPAATSQVIIQGGFNDIAFDPSEVGAAVTRTLALIHAQAPQATVTVVGMFNPGPDTFVNRYPNMRSDAAAIQQATASAGDRFVDGFSMRYEVGPDGSHPSPTGHADLGHAIAGAVRSQQPAAVGQWTGRLNSRAAAVIGVSRVGAFGARYFYLATTEGGRLGPVTRVAFGDAGDLPALLTTASGECTPAVYRPATGTLYAATQNIDGGGHVEVVPFGDPGDQLVQNASSANSSSRIVTIRRPSTGTFFARSPGAGAQPDVSALGFGDRGDRGFMYSGEGSGTTLGVYRPGNSTFFMADGRPGSSALVTSLPFGNPGDQGLVGAWGWNNADGSDRVGVFRPANGQWFLADTPTRLIGGQATPVAGVTSFFFGNPGDTALACDPV